MKKEIKLESTLEVYDWVEDLSPEDARLLHAARQALPQAYAPYSGFLVSATVLLENGAIITGTNHENAAYPMCLCAERVALAAAHAQFPGVPVKTIAVTTKNVKASPASRGTGGHPASPCGACRQVICETEFRYKNPIQIILQGETGAIYKLQSGKDLLPLAFDGNFL